MIVADRKPFEEIQESLKDYHRILILGCGTCVSVCMAGGEKEVELLASELRMARGMDKRNIQIEETTVQRQCDREYIEPITEKARECDAVLSMACGAGVQLVAEMLETMPVIPALNTRFIGITEAEGYWAERCRACGDCVLASFGGICPVTRCSKSLINGPCGGNQGGKCEAGNDKDCAWELIYHRLKKQGKLENLRKVTQPRNHAANAHPTQQVNEAYREPAKTAAES